MDKIIATCALLLTLVGCTFDTDPMMEGIDAGLMIVLETAAVEEEFMLREGLRTIEQQRRYYDAGSSKTMDSRHLTGHAMDVTAIDDGEVTWELEEYIEIAEAVRIAAIQWDVRIRWGGSWTVLNDELSAEIALAKYVARNPTPFIDAGHFEVVKEK